jgi:hypothetical protein
MVGRWNAVVAHRLRAFAMGVTHAIVHPDNDSLDAMAMLFFSATTAHPLLRPG